MKHILFSLLIFFPFCSSIAQKVVKKDLTYVSMFKIKNEESVRKNRLTVVMPQTIEGRQKVNQIKLSQTPDTIYIENGVKYAVFESINPTANETIAIEVSISIIEADLKTLSKKKLLATDNDTIPALFLCAEKYIEKDDSLIQAKAKELIGKTEEKTLKNIYNFVIKQITYAGYNPKAMGARHALLYKKGDCTEFTDLFVALCRANNIPARHICGLTSQWGNTPVHGWVEVYMKKLGWVPFDATPGNGQSFNTMLNKYIYLSPIRNDKNLNNFQFYAFRYWGGKTTVDHQMWVK